MEKNREISGADFRVSHDFADDIMTAQEYADLTNRKLPHRYELAKDGKALIAYGSGHFSNPDNPAFKVIAEDVKNLHPDLILIEGLEAINTISDEEKEAHRTNATVSAEDILKRHGENAYLASLAIESGIEVQSPEPSRADLNNYALERGATKEQIFAEEIATLIHQYNWLTDKPSFDEYISGWLERVKIEFGWEGFDFSMDNFKRILKESTGKEFDLEDKETIKQCADPIPWPDQQWNGLRAAAQLRNLARDRHIIHEIEEALKTHNKIYIVFGASHLVMLEPALRKMMDVDQE